MSGDLTAVTVPRIVRTLMAARAVSLSELAEHLGIGRSSLSERLTGKRRFTLAEVADMADYFEVSPAVFFEDPANLIGAYASSEQGGRYSGCITEDEAEPLDRHLVAAGT
jgi:transcriptional regulator with XRE-family HTH domain